jgi:hypothetical protein
VPLTPSGSPSVNADAAGSYVHALSQSGRGTGQGYCTTLVAPGGHLNVRTDWSRLASPEECLFQLTTAPHRTCCRTMISHDAPVSRELREVNAMSSERAVQRGYFTFVAGAIKPRLISLAVCRSCFACTDGARGVLKAVRTA